jgi:membrane fusion protein, heavy metal efflux system
MILRHYSASRRAQLLGLAFLSLVTVAVTWLFAHEGHAPLPTKGAQVDVEKGRIVLAAPARSALDVAVAKVEIRPFSERVLSYVTLTAPWQKHAFATSQLPGRILHMHVRPGEAVKAGELLAEVYSPQLEALRLELVAAQTALGLSKKTLDLLKSTPGSVSGRDVEQAETKQQQDLNTLEITKTKWISLGLEAKDLEIVLKDAPSSRPLTLPVRSPIDGIVIHADLTVGRVIEPSEHLFEIVNLETVWVRIDVLEKDMHRIAVGQHVELSLAAYPGESFATTVKVESQSLDPATHLVSYWGQLTNPSERPAQFLPGMKGQAFVRVNNVKQAKVIPSSALIEDGLDHYVLVEEANSALVSEYQKKHVVVLRRDEKWIEIKTSEVFPGDRVVTRGAHELGSFLVPGVLRLSAQGADTIGLKVEAVQKRVVEEVLETDAQVETPPDRRSFASPQIDGTLQKIHVDRGQAVSKDQLLGEVASLEFQNLQLELLKEHLAFQLLESQHKALKSIDQVISKLRILQLESELALSRQRKETLSSRLTILGMSKEQITHLTLRKKLTKLLPVKAAAAGTLVHFDKVLGQAVKADEKLFTVHDLGKPLVEGFVSERDVRRLQMDKRQAVRIRFSSEPDKFFSGKVVRSSGVFGSDSRTVSVWVELDEAPKTNLLYKQLARLSIVVKRRPPTTAVPLTAVVHEGISSFVFVQKGERTFERQEVKTGHSDDLYIEILHGLEPGQLVAVRGTSELQTAHASLR